MIKNVTVIGLGLIGGSVARALRKHTDIPCIVGIDPNASALNDALNEKVISAGYESLNHQIGQSDIIFVCCPVSKITYWIKEASKLVKPDCIITDAGSVKKSIIDEVHEMDGNFHFVGGHPLAGSEKTGFNAGSAHLFENAYYMLCRCNKTAPGDVEILAELLKQIGSIPVEINCSEHDYIAGAISHIPHIASAALVNIVSRIDNSETLKFAAGGFRDITRISSSSPQMWHDITFANRTAMLELLDDYISLLTDIKNDIVHNHSGQLYDFFSRAKDFRDKIVEL